MKETTAKRRDKAAGRDRDSKAEKPKEPEDVEMPEEEAANAVKPPKEQDSLTLEGKAQFISTRYPPPPFPLRVAGTGAGLLPARRTENNGSSAVSLLA